MHHMNKLIKELATATARNYRKGQVILHQDDQNNSVFYIEKGYVKVYDVTDSGHEKLLLILGPQDIFPLDIGFDNKQVNMYYYEAMSNVETKIFSIENLLEVASTNHAAANTLFRYYAEITKKLMSRLQVIESTNANSKILNTLPYIIQSCGKEILPNIYKLHLKLTHQDIANMAGLARETVSSEIKKLQKSGIILANDNSLTIDIGKISQR